MQRSQVIKIYLVCLLAAGALDGIWLGIVAKSFYFSRLDYVLAENVYWPAGIGFYLLHPLGSLILVILPALREKSWRFLLGRAAIYGLCTYATWDLTNWATIKDWPAIVAVVDMIWGTCFTTAVASVGFWFGLRRTE